MWRLYGQEAGSATPGNAGWLAFLHPDDRPRIEAEMGRLLASEATRFRDEFRVAQSDGTGAVDRSHRPGDP